jgi:hypothetical protein
MEMSIYKRRSINGNYFAYAVVTYDVHETINANKVLKALSKIGLVPKDLWFHELKFFPTISSDLYNLRSKHILK